MLMAATFILNLSNRAASRLRVQSLSNTYLPLDHPKPTVCIELPAAFKHVSMPDDCILGLIAEPTGILDAAPAP